VIERQDPFPQLQKPLPQMTALTYSPGLRFQINSSLTSVPLLFEQALLLQLVTKERMPYYRIIGEMKQAREEFRQSN
jgi:hypothetical protein